MHHVDGYDLMSAEEWGAMVSKVSKPLRLRAGQQVIECGCGAGAFLSSLVRLYPGVVVSGVDYSSSMVNKASKGLDGRFVVGDIRDLHFLPEAAYDCVLSFGTLFYLDSVKDAKRAVREMVRLVKPGGVLMIGEVNDLAKKSMA
ncbi:MAG: class I SAM-dependent methyltransferase, partial [Limisphaerales bacterium]